jgi:hypothetical protein
VSLLERRLVEILLAPDPARALAAAQREPALRRVLRRAAPDGVRMAALLVARLRFERLLRASPEAAAAFDADPAAFTAGFRRYHAEVPPTAFFPAGEAALYRAWRNAAPPEEGQGARRDRAPRRSW